MVEAGKFPQSVVIHVRILLPAMPALILSLISRAELRFRHRLVLRNHNCPYGILEGWLRRYKYQCLEHRADEDSACVHLTVNKLT